MIKLIFILSLLLSSWLVQSQSFDYPDIGLGCSPSSVDCKSSRDLSKNSNITMRLENIDDKNLILKTKHQDLNSLGHQFFLGNQMKNLEKGIEYKLNLNEDYVFSEEEINAFRFSENLIIPKGEYTVYFDEENIYLKYKLR